MFACGASVGIGAGVPVNVSPFATGDISDHGLSAAELLRHGQAFGSRSSKMPLLYEATAFSFLTGAGRSTSAL